jgi:hypothetical protein
MSDKPRYYDPETLCPTDYACVIADSEGTEAENELARLERERDEALADRDRYKAAWDWLPAHEAWIYIEETRTDKGNLVVSGYSCRHRDGHCYRHGKTPKVAIEKTPLDAVEAAMKEEPPNAK